MKKILKIMLVLLIIGIVIIIFSILLNKNYRTKFESLNETDQQMLQELSTIYINFEDSSEELWNGEYRFDKKPLILIRTNKDKGIIRREAYAINVKQIENSIFAKEIQIPKSLNLPKVYRLSRFDPKTLSAWFPSNFGTVDIGNNEIFYLKYYPKMFHNPDLYFDFSSFLLHETFHTYKQKEWVYDIVDDGEYIPDYPHDKENYALMGLEFKLLDKAMSTTNPEVIKQHIYDWTIVRHYRYKKWPQLIGETKSEAIEGAARYLEYRYSNLIGGNLTVLATKQPPYHATFMQAFDVIANGQAESPTFLKKSIRYETGSAIGLLMDKANISWKTKLEDSIEKRGMTQYEILNSYFEIDVMSNIANKIDEIKENNEYTALLKQGEKLVRISSTEEK